jgi:hypothetical protein
LTNSDQADLAQNLIQDGMSFLARHFSQAKAKIHVLAHGFPWEKRRLLKDNSAIRAGTIDLGAINQQRPGMGQLKTGDGADEAGFSTTGWAEDGQELAGLDVEGKIIESDDRVAAAAKHQRHILEIDGALSHRACTR